MKKVDSVIQCGTLLTVNANNRIIHNASVVIDKGFIVDITTPKQVLRKYEAEKLFDCSSQLVMPGLINAHTHAAMSLFRGMADDLPLMEWLQDHIWPAEAQWVNESFVRDGTELAIAEMIKSGTTCFNDMYFFPDMVADVAQSCGIRAAIGLIVIDFPTVWAQNADEYLSKGVALYDQYHNHSSIHCNFAPHAPYTVSDEAFKRIVTYINELDIPIVTHLHETAVEVSQAEKETGKRPIAHLAELGVISPALTAVHMTQLNIEEIALLAKEKVNVVHCPHSNLKLASGFCPVAQLQKAGVNVALGTDGAASNNQLDLLREMQTAALLAKGVAENASAVNATNAIRMATINGAKALGIDHITGSIEVGKSADLISMDLSELNSQPLYRPASQVVYACNASQVKNSWVQGKMLMKNRQLLTLNEQEIINNAQMWQQQVAQNEPDIKR